MTLSTFKHKIQNQKWSINWAFISMFCILFSIIYEYFSHGVYSLAMIFMFVYPLLLGSIPCYVLAKKRLCMPNRFYQDGIVILTLGSLIQGILEIYGTSSTYVLIFQIIGIVCLLLGGFLTSQTIRNSL